MGMRRLWSVLGLVLIAVVRSGSARRLQRHGAFVIPSALMLFRFDLMSHLPD